MRVIIYVSRFFKRLGVRMQPKLKQEFIVVEDKSAGGFQNFSDRMTTGLAYASGGAAIGTFIGGPIGGTVGAIITGSAGLIYGGNHKSKTHGH